MNKYQEYWANPNDGSNKPEEYLIDNSGKTSLLVDIFKKYVVNKRLHYFLRL